MKKTYLLILPLLLTAFFSFGSSKISFIEKEKIINWEMAKIKSKEQIYKELEIQDSPLYLLSDSARNEFIDSIVFSENGLGSYAYSPLESELTPTQIYKVLALFGAQHTVYISQNARALTATDLILLEKPMATENSRNKTLRDSGAISIGADHTGYECLRRATCAAKARHVCMSSC